MPPRKGKRLFKPAHQLDLFGPDTGETQDTDNSVVDDKVELLSDLRAAGHDEQQFHKVYTKLKELEPKQLLKIA